MTRYTVVLCMVAALAAGGCGNRSKTLPDGADGGANGGFGGDGGASTVGADGGGGFGVSPLDAEQQQLLDRLVVYFDYDQAEISPEFNQMLAAHGRYLAQNPRAS